MNLLPRAAIAGSLLGFTSANVADTPLETEALSKLSIPGLWIFGGQDNSIPVDLSVARLEELIAAGKPFEYRVFPELGHILVDATHPFPLSMGGYRAGSMHQQVTQILVAALGDPQQARFPATGFLARHKSKPSRKGGARS